MKTMSRVCFAVLLVGSLAVGCGDDESSEADSGVITLTDAAVPDGPTPDAFVCTQTECGTACVDLETDPLHCGECSNACTPSGSCGGAKAGCECPDNFVPESISTIVVQFDDTTLAPLTLGIGVGAGTDSLSHGFVVGADLATVETGVDIDLATAEDATFAVLYEFAGSAPTSIFIGTAGTLNLDRACSDGMGGTLTNVTLSEASMGGLLPDGCVITVPTATFSYGSDCEPDPPDAGSM